MRLLIFALLILMTCCASKQPSESPSGIRTQADFHYLDDELILDLTIQNDTSKEICIYESDLAYWQYLDRNDAPVDIDFLSIGDSFGIHRHIRPNEIRKIKGKPIGNVASIEHIYSIKKSLPIFLCSDVETEDQTLMFKPLLNSQWVHMGISRLSPYLAIKEIEIQYNLKAGE